MKLSKDQRFTAYCIMLAEVQINLKDYRGYGFCYLATRLFDIYAIQANIFKDFFPDLYSKKPESAFRFWFSSDKEGWKKRIELLKQCIEEVS